jgi:hypothetical protein
VHPAGTEVAYDGLDNDCNDATPDDDVDGDGYDLAADCDDTSGVTFPGANEVCGDGQVNDCDSVATPGRQSCFTGRSLTTSDAWLMGSSTNDYAGFTVAAAGDLNADGFDDLLVGAYGEGSNSTGAVYVVHGPVTGAFDLSGAAAKLLGESEDDWAGYAIASSGDSLGTGEPGILVGAQYDDYSGANAGAVYMLRGTTVGDAFLAESYLKLVGAAAHQLAGYAVANAGDINDDGKDDVVVGAIQHELVGIDAGAVHIVYGGLSGIFGLDQAPVTLLGMASNHSTGNALDGNVDATGDGVPDLLVGAFRSDRPDADNAGTAFLLSSYDVGFVDLELVLTRFNGETGGDLAGTSLAFAGDLDNNGSPDIVVGAPGQDENGTDAGAVYVFHDGGTRLPDYDVKIMGANAGDQAGSSVDSAGDVDGDGFGDLIIGGPTSDVGGEDSGGAWLVFGPVSGTMDLNAADVQLSGGAAFDFAGTSVSGVGDIDNDGFDDVVIGAPFNDTLSPSTGAAMLMTFNL